ncbi:hypothetical protein G9P44_000652 [Scheffersomyces stipitis]|nr:hypothetical protein G9P44_000652 [Scheffersomyces stipitis]
MSCNAVEQTRVQTHSPRDLQQPFQRLSLSIPVDAKKYNLICLFLTHILNLEDPKAMLVQDPPARLPRPDKIVEIIPKVVFPYDIWAQPDVFIKDIKIKTTMLQEINNMIELDLTTNVDSPINVDTTLNYYEKLLMAYKVYECPVKVHPSPIYTHPPSVREDVYEDDFSSLNRTASNTNSIVSQKTFGSYSYSNNGSVNHISSTSLSNPKRINGSPLMAPRRRFSGVLSGHNDSTGELPTVHQNGNANANGNGTQEGAINSILGKSRIYNKLKKHRESAGSINSNMSRDSNYSNRNSVSTTVTTTSSIGSRRRVSNGWSPEVNENRFTPNSHPSTPALSSAPVMSSQQREENQKDKYDYYVHMIRLLVITERLLTIVVNDNNKTGYNDKWVKYLDFIKKRVLKFIIIDTTQMILDYAKMKSAILPSSSTVR